MEVVIHEDPQAVAEATAAAVVEAIDAKDGRFSLGLAGGSSPEQTYRVLRSQHCDWSKVTGWLGDERWVPHDSDRSNGRMAAEALFDHVEAALVRPEYDASISPEESATRYGRFLRELHDAQRPDLILLGLGSDGHTASLFPGSTALVEDHHWYVANRIPETGEERLTATYPLLDLAERVIFVVVGESKAEAVRQSHKGVTPAGRLADSEGQVVWHLDRAAASLLD